MERDRTLTDALDRLEQAADAITKTHQQQDELLVLLAEALAHAKAGRAALSAQHPAPLDPSYASDVGGDVCSGGWFHQWYDGATLSVLRVANELGKAAYVGEFGLRYDFYHRETEWNGCPSGGGSHEQRAQVVDRKLGIWFGAEGGSMEGAVFWDAAYRDDFCDGATCRALPGDPLLPVLGRHTRGLP